ASKRPDVGTRQNIAVGTGASLALAAESSIARHVGTKNLAASAVTRGQKQRLGQRRSKMCDQAQPGPVANIQEGREGKLVFAVLRRRTEKSNRVIEVSRKRQQILVAEASRDIVAEAGMSIGDLETAVSNAAQRAGDL